MVKTMKWFDWLAFWLIVIGAVNWGLVGFFNFNLVDYLGSYIWKWFATIVYAIVGLAGLFAVYTGIKLAIK